MNNEYTNIERYRKTARIRHVEEQNQIRKRYQKAWDTVYQLSGILKEEFGVTEIFVFGSLRHFDLFHDHSDIDIAVKGINEKEYYHAVARVMTAEFNVDLIMIESSSDRMKQCIKKEGIRL
ncbi:MAG: nucleotidyltransferase domain-containing protein [Candidatus Magnetomorum sp.]|nr:nucleotidyltransferase domain-containing protein [Candidatus Magnetomorum sp.]